ncbi:MAG: tRNA (adenosine(37)-N6)-dimethylallyltransferase MiaA [Planctomycetaceae bacterium]|nr:tRNA (adenosine(37)-N6)-dimethylallyltransferase MiaA [Planctomycetaceae bacterium]
MPDSVGTHAGGDPDERVLPNARATPRVLVILGPTAGGKSDLAMELARRLGGELVSADSMQVYRGMDIGTAKPTAAERAEIPHHGLDLVDASEEGFTVARWLAIADRAVDEILARGRTPIVVGGTNLYIRAFLEGLDEAPPADSAFRASLEALSNEELHARLAASDAPAAARLHPNDRRRITRALEIAHTTGDSASARRTAWDDAGVTPRRDDLFTVILDWPVEAINRRINARVRRMFEVGFVDEVAGLLAHGGLCAQARAACGYEELVHALGDGSRPPRTRDLEDAAESTKIRSRRLAKQQRTWMKRFRALRPGLAIDCDETTTVAGLADRVTEALVRAAREHA